MSNDETRVLLAELRRLAKRIAANDALRSRRIEIIQQLAELGLKHADIAKAAGMTRNAVDVALHAERRKAGGPSKV